MPLFVASIVLKVQSRSYPQRPIQTHRDTRHMIFTRGRPNAHSRAEAGGLGGFCVIIESQGGVQGGEDRKFIWGPFRMEGAKFDECKEIVHKLRMQAAS